MNEDEKKQEAEKLENQQQDAQFSEKAKEEDKTK